MPKIQRKTQKVFCNSADSDQLAVFGSMSTGTPVYSSDVEELQSNEAFDLGWDAATLEDKAPFMEEMNGVQYGLTYQIAYGLQEGLPEYDSATTYYIGSICKVLEDGKPILYTSLTDDNIGNDPVNDSTNWERLPFGGGGLEIGDVGFTQMAIDESKGKRRILNGQLIIQDQYVQFTNIIKATQALNPDLFCTEAEWQTELASSVNNFCDKYVIDDEAGTIRLPKYPEYLDFNKRVLIKTYSSGNNYYRIYSDGFCIQGGGVFGNGGTGNYTVNLIIPFKNTDYTVTLSNYTSSSYAASIQTKTTTSFSGGYLGRGNDWQACGYVDISTYTDLYEGLIKGTHFIQVATGAETEDNITNEHELINPFTLLESKYSESVLNNPSWLLSEGQWNAGSVYVSAYELLLKIYNGAETREGISVKLVTEEYTDYDFVLNTDDVTFRLPLQVKQKFFNANSGDVPVVGNGMCLGLTNGNSNVGLALASNTSTGFGGQVSMYGAQLGVAGTGWLAGGNYNMGVTTDSSKSGLVAKLSLSEVDGLYLYFYVGEVAQNANLVNIGRIEETMATKKMVDGQWVDLGIQAVITTSTTIGTFTYSLADILPKDGYNYEILFAVEGTASSSTSALDIGSSIISRMEVGQAQSDNYFRNTVLIPIGADRVLNWYLAGAAPTEITGKILGYRRIGTNL